MARKVPDQREGLFILGLFNIVVSEDLGEGVGILPGIKITNNNIVVKKLLTPFFKDCIGNIEYESLQNAKAVLYSTDSNVVEFHSESNKPLERLERLLQLCRNLILSSWLIKDNSVNFELGFLKYSIGKATSVSSNFLASIFTDATGTIMPVEFSKHELEELAGLFEKSLFNLILYPKDQKKYSRLSIVLNYIDAARRTDDLGLKISFYCVCLEALFSVDTTELSHKISERIAFFIGETSEEKVEIYKKTKSAYSIRSKIVHGDMLTSKSFETALDTSFFCDDILRRIFIKILRSESLIKIFNSDNPSLDRFLIDITFGVRLPE